MIVIIKGEKTRPAEVICCAVASSAQLCLSSGTAYDLDEAGKAFFWTVNESRITAVF